MFHFALCFLLCQIFVEGHQHSITLVHDDSINVQHPKDSVELWIQLIIENIKTQCRMPISVNIVYLAHNTDFTEVTQLSNGGISTNSFIVVMQCESAVAFIRHLRTLQSEPNIIFLDPFICQPLQKLEAFHLQIFRFESAIRLVCTQLVVNKWMRDTICSSELDKQTINLLNSIYSTEIVLGECNEYQNLAQNSEIYVLNSKAAENYVRHFINGKKLRIASVEEVPIVIFDRSPQTNVVNYRGFSFEVFNILQNHFNFTYTVLLPEDGEFGTEITKGNWSGLVGMLINQEVDIAVQLLSLSHSRYQVTDFSVPIDRDPVEMLIPALAEDDFDFACLKPFHYKEWMAVLSVVVLLPFILWIYGKKSQSAHNELYGSSLTDFFFFVYKVLLGQSTGQRIQRTTIFMTLLMMTWSLCAIVVSNAYTGNMLSHLLIQRQSSTINSLEELVASSLNWIIRRGSSAETRFMDTDEKEINHWKIRERFLQHPELLIEPGPDRPQKIQDLVVSGKYVYIGARSSVKHIMEKDYLETKQCRMIMAKEYITLFNVGFLLKKNSPLTGIFNQKILQIQQSGLDIYWYHRSYPLYTVENDCKNVQTNEGEKKLSLQSLRSTFLVLVIGLALATGAFFLEIVYYLWQRKHMEHSVEIRRENE